MEILNANGSIENRILHIWLPAGTEFEDVEFHYGETDQIRKYIPRSKPTSDAREKVRKHSGVEVRTLFGNLG